MPLREDTIPIKQTKISPERMQKSFPNRRHEARANEREWFSHEDGYLDYKNEAPPSSKRKVLGSGSQTIVWDSKDNPGMVNKLTKLETSIPSKDAHVQYILSMKKYAMSNPYLPKIYRMSFFKTSDGATYMRSTMEKLHSFNTSPLTSATLRAMYERMFVGDLPYDVYPGKLVDMLDQHIYRPKFSLIKDHKLIEAIKIIIAAKNKIGVHSDLAVANNNAMYRLTSLGPQLVLNDPLLGRAKT